MKEKHQQQQKIEEKSLNRSETYFSFSLFSSDFGPSHWDRRNRGRRERAQLVQCVVGVASLSNDYVKSLEKKHCQPGQFLLSLLLLLLLLFTFIEWMTTGEKRQYPFETLQTLGNKISDRADDDAISTNQQMLYPDRPT